MSKKHTPRPKVTNRIESPKITKDETGAAVLLCPFCNPPHTLRTDGISGCGTIIQVRAVQAVYRSNLHKDMVCVKCQKSGGDMVQFNDAFVHIADCMPGVTTITEEVQYSKFAKFVFGLRPGKLKKYLETRYGEVKSVAEVTPNGERTGKILGYFFYKKKV